MKRKNLKQAVLLIFCFGILITGVGVGTGVIARNRQRLLEKRTQEKQDMATFEESEKRNEKTVSDTEKENIQKKSEEILSSFETTSESEEARDQNLRAACEKLNGIELAPQEILSFNDTVGPYTEEAGYRAGPAIIAEGQVGEELGGGVCQVSTTLYNAAIRGNLGVVERHRHSFPMDYVEVGLDAMINDPDSDLKIQNTTDVPLFIEAYAQRGTVSVKFKGAKLDDGMRVQVESAVLNTEKPEGEEIQLSTELAEGSREVLQEERTGYETRVSRKVYNGEELISDEVLSEDIYPPVRRIIIEGCQQSK